MPPRLAVLPKDYLRLRLTGEVASDISDASATALFDITGGAGRTGSATRSDLPARLLPTLLESADVAGLLTQAAAAELGLRPARRSWRAAPTSPRRPSRTGCWNAGRGSVTLGTGGQIMCATECSPGRRPRAHPHLLPRRPGPLVSARSDAVGRALAALAARPTAATSANPYANLDRLAARSHRERTASSSCPTS